MQQGQSSASSQSGAISSLFSDTSGSSGLSSTAQAGVKKTVDGTGQASVNFSDIRRKTTKGVTGVAEDGVCVVPSQGRESGNVTCPSQEFVDQNLAESKV